MSRRGKRARRGEAGVQPFYEYVGEPVLTVGGTAERVARFAQAFHDSYHGIRTVGSLAPAWPTPDRRRPNRDVLAFTTRTEADGSITVINGWGSEWPADRRVSLVGALYPMGAK